MTLLVITDPPGMVPIFLALTGPLPARDRNRAAWQAVALALGVIVVFAVAGQTLLDYLHVDLPALQGAGGLLLVLVALELLTGKADDPSQQATSNIALVPLGTPLLAGPGAIVATMLFVQRADGLGDYAGDRASAIVAVMVAVWLVLRFSGVHREDPAARRDRGADPDRRPAAGRDRGAAHRRRGGRLRHGVRRTWPDRRARDVGRWMAGSQACDEPHQRDGRPPAAGPPAARRRAEQLGFAGMPERLFVCTPSKLGAYADCPRRYRYTYVDRPAPPKGPPWAHNSLGASVHTALRTGMRCPPSGARPEALRHAAQGHLGARGLPRRRAGAGGLPAGAGLAGVVRRRRWTRTSSRSAWSGWWRPRPRCWRFNGRADRIDSRPGPDGPELVIVDYKTGRTGLDADDARGSQALALYAYAAERVFRRPCRRVELHHLPTGTVAAHEHTDGVAGPAGAPGRGDRPRHHGRREGGRRRRRPGRGVPDHARAALRLVRLPAAPARRARRRRARSRGRRWTGPPTAAAARADRTSAAQPASAVERRAGAGPLLGGLRQRPLPVAAGHARRARAAARARSGPPTARWWAGPARRTSGGPRPAAARTRCRRCRGTPSAAGPG